MSRPRTLNELLEYAHRTIMERGGPQIREFYEPITDEEWDALQTPTAAEEEETNEPTIH